MGELLNCQNLLFKCQNELTQSLARRGELLKENNKLKNENNKLRKGIERLEDELSDTTPHGYRTPDVGRELSDRTSSFDSYITDRTSSFDSEFTDRTFSGDSYITDRTFSGDSYITDRTFQEDGIQKGEIKETDINLEVTFSLKDQEDYKTNIKLRITNKDTINDIKQNILQKISVEELNKEQIIIIDKTGRVINEDYPNLFDIFKNENVSVVVIDKQHDFLSKSSDQEGGSYIKKKSKKRRKSKKRKSKKKRRNKKFTQNRKKNRKMKGVLTKKVE